jgi:hypothetical protein
MAAGISEHSWTLDELVARIVTDRFIQRLWSVVAAISAQRHQLLYVVSSRAGVTFTPSDH